MKQGDSLGPGDSFYRNLPISESITPPALDHIPVRGRQHSLFDNENPQPSL